MRRAHEEHPVFPRAHNVLKDLCTTVLLIALAINPSQVERHETAVADGEHASIDHCTIGGVALHGGDDHAVGHAHVARLSGLDLSSNGTMNLATVKLVADIEVSLHKKVVE